MNIELEIDDKTIVGIYRSLQGCPINPNLFIISHKHFQHGNIDIELSLSQVNALREWLNRNNDRLEALRKENQ